MSKKDFELIASILRRAKGKGWEDIVVEFTGSLSMRYPRFNAVQFFEACGACHRCRSAS